MPLNAEQLLLQRTQENPDVPLAEQLRPGQAATPAAYHEAVLAQLPNPPAQPAAAATSVSTARLSHKIPKAAKKAFDQASSLVKKKQYSEAAALFEKAIAIDPGFADAHNDLGAQYMALGRRAEAEREFQNAIALDAAFAVARANLANTMYLRGDWVGAEKEAQRALSFSPSNRPSLHLLDLIRSRQGQ
jgi:Flp pilus assembly protein TadD